MLLRSPSWEEEEGSLVPSPGPVAPMQRGHPMSESCLQRRRETGSQLGWGHWVPRPPPCKSHQLSPTPHWQGSREMRMGSPSGQGMKSWKR